MIYLVSMYYPPENNPPAHRMDYFAETLAGSIGRDSFRVVTGRPNYPTGKLARGFRFRLWKKTMGQHGEQVQHLYEFPAVFKGLYRKTLGMVSFAGFLFMYLVFRRYKSNDLVFVTSGPGFNILAVYYASILRPSLRYVLDIRDLWPEGVAGMGFMKESGRAYRFLKRSVDKAYLKAERVVGNSEGIVESISKTLDPSLVDLVHNPIRIDRFMPLDDSLLADYRTKRFDLFDGRVTLTFTGTFAFYIDLPIFMDALNLLDQKSKEKLHVILLGDGEERINVTSLISRYGLEQAVTILPFTNDRSELVSLIQASDFCFASLKDTPTLRYAIPTKILEYSACGKPIIAALSGPFSEVLKNQKAAHVVPPGDPIALAEVLTKLIKNPDDYRQTGANARALILSEFSPAAVAKLFLNTLAKVSISSEPSS